MERGVESVMMQCLLRHLCGGVVGGLLGMVMVGYAASPTNWENQVTAGRQAYDQGHYAEAKQYWKAALKEAETFGVDDTRFATSLNNLAVLYLAQGQYAQAEPLYQRSLAIWEKTLGPEHPDVATSLENYAALLRAMNPVSARLPWSKAAKLEARAKAIRAKRAQQNPSR